MNVMCFSDLHINCRYHYNLSNMQYLVKKYNPDVVAISGDIFDNQNINPYEELSKIGDFPIICCLGNHEFAYSSIDFVLNRYKELYNPDKYNVHYLDVIGKKEIGDINFVGNVLWYDGSLCNFREPSLKIDDKWLDSSIIDFNYVEENKKCINQINKNLSSDKKNFLITHCVPHKDLDLFSIYGSISSYNTYSGMENLFEKLNKKINYAVCGHTHRYTTKEIDGILCVNVGNDYIDSGKSFRYFIMES